MAEKKPMESFYNESMTSSVLRASVMENFTSFFLGAGRCLRTKKIQRANALDSDFLDRFGISPRRHLTPGCQTGGSLTAA